MEKMYVELMNVKNEVKSVKGEVQSLKGEVQSQGKRLDNIEQEVKATNAKIDGEILKHPL